MVPLGQALIADSMAGTSSVLDDPPAFGVQVDARGFRTRSGTARTTGAGIGSAAAKPASATATTEKRIDLLDRIMDCSQKNLDCLQEHLGHLQILFLNIYRHFAQPFT